ncbi:MAG TPA: lipase maturation factor family protein, partial [Polyangia bacterium]
MAWTFQRALALVFLLAWISLGAQVRLLIGARGLLPFADFVESARAAGVLGFTSFPSWLVFASGDLPLVAGTVLGAALALLALAGAAPRACLAAQTFLYLGYAVACRSFLGFQWDNLLLEAGTLATFLPTSRAAPLAHFLFRALLFKLYFESGLAKWQSPIGDWRDGSAMTFYYETAPLPTALAWFAHNLPTGWHHFESWAALALELLVPFAFFGPRPARLAAGAAFTLFQIANAATANYGFFCYLAVTLHLFLLDDRDVRALVAGRERLGRWLRARLAAAAAPRHQPICLRRTVRRLRRLVSRRRRARVALALGGGAAWGVLSLGEGLFMFSGLDPAAPAARPLAAVIEAAQPYRLVGTYHLFASVTRERIEPEVQVDDATTAPGPRWQPLAFHYKPG